MTEELPSDFHLSEALRREHPDWDEDEIAEGLKKVKRFPACTTIAHARTLAEFMKEPVDPLLLQAREICAKIMEIRNNRLMATRYRKGKCDHTPEVQFVYKCLRKAAGGVE